MGLPWTHSDTLTLGARAPIWTDIDSILGHQAFGAISFAMLAYLSISLSSTLLIVFVSLSITAIFTCLVPVFSSLTRYIDCIAKAPASSIGTSSWYCFSRNSVT